MMINASSPPLALALLLALTPAIGWSQPANVRPPAPASASAPATPPPATAPPPEAPSAGAIPAAAVAAAPGPAPASVPPSATPPPSGSDPAAGGAAAPAGTPPPQAPAPGGTPAAENANITQLEGFLEPFIYDIVNRRDPFVPYAEFVPKADGVEDTGPQRALSPAQRWDLDQLKLIGIMWDIKDPKAMFLDPEQDVMILGRDESVGNRNGYVATIREGEVVVVEALRKKGDIVYRTKVLRIER